jgi:signal recognition particle GTPase
MATNFVKGASVLRSIRLKAATNEAIDLVFVQTAGRMQERGQQRLH